jgi:hypothetical protein
VVAQLVQQVELELHLLYLAHKSNMLVAVVGVDILAVQLAHLDLALLVVEMVVLFQILALVLPMVMLVLPTQALAVVVVVPTILLEEQVAQAVLAS